jgi:ABC-type glucose/galactose transport system permease subunit
LAESRPLSSIVVIVTIAVVIVLVLVEHNDLTPANALFALAGTPHAKLVSGMISRLGRMGLPHFSQIP